MILMQRIFRFALNLLYIFHQIFHFLSLLYYRICDIRNFLYILLLYIDQSKFLTVYLPFASSSKLEIPIVAYKLPLNVPPDHVIVGMTKISPHMTYKLEHFGDVALRHYE